MPKFKIFEKKFQNKTNTDFSASGNICTRLRSSLDPTNLELLVYVHENGTKVKMTYDSSLIPTPPGQAPPAQPVDPVVNIDWSF